MNTHAFSYSMSKVSIKVYEWEHLVVHLRMRKRKHCVSCLNVIIDICEKILVNIFHNLSIHSTAIKHCWTTTTITNLIWRMRQVPMLINYSSLISVKLAYNMKSHSKWKCSSKRARTLTQIERSYCNC